jgi:DNA-binding response OmpR family regulator
MAHTILLVDDDPQLSHVVSMFFEIEGYVVMVAPSGRAALDMLAETRPDVMLLDVMMPEISGLDVCRQVRANAKTKTLPIIVFTAAERQEEDLRAAGADRFINKPYSLQGLKDVVVELIGQP